METMMLLLSPVASLLVLLHAAGRGAYGNEGRNGE
jgi:hypothetical protein